MSPITVESLLVPVHILPHYHIKYEKYSIELLGVVADLWITIRDHSFAKDWTMNLVRK